MENYESINEILNDLIKINNDRISSYEKAIKEAGNLDIDLKSIFDSLIGDSQQFKEELSEQIRKTGGIAEDESTLSGKIYRAWMDIKSTFVKNDRHSILEFCAFGEDATQRAYETALSSELLLDPEVYKLVEEEQASLKIASDLIKKQLDAHSALQK